MKKTKIGLIGCGKQAVKHISGLRLIPGVEIVLADIDPALAASLGAKCSLAHVKSPDMIFADPSIAGVDICTPTPSHFSLINQALMAQKSVFCEKPLCETLEQAAIIEKQVQESGCFIQAGYVYRFAPLFDRAYSILHPKDGSESPLGKTVWAFFRLGGRGSHRLWKHRRDQGGGAIREMLVHMLDLALWYFGPLNEVEVLDCRTSLKTRMIQGKEETVDAEDFVLVRCRGASGHDIHVQADLITPSFCQYVEILGQNGSFMGSIQPQMPGHLFLKEDREGYPAGKTDLQTPGINLYDGQMAMFASALRGERELDRNTVADTVELMKALETINEQVWGEATADSAKRPKG